MHRIIWAYATTFSIFISAAVLLPQTAKAEEGMWIQASVLTMPSPPPMVNRTAFKQIDNVEGLTVLKWTDIIANDEQSSWHENVVIPTDGPCSDLWPAGEELLGKGVALYKFSAKSYRKYLSTGAPIIGRCLFYHGYGDKQIPLPTFLEYILGDREGGSIANQHTTWIWVKD